MEYFQIRQDDRADNCIIPQLAAADEIWKSDQPLFIPASARNPANYIYFLPYIDKPLAMVSDAFKKIIETYQSRTLFRPCAVGSMEQRKVEVYWLVKPRVIDCLHEDTTYFVDGTLKEICISKEKAGFNKAFAIDGVKGNHFIVDTEVLERLYREGLTALKIIPVKAV